MEVDKDAERVNEFRKIIESLTDEESIIKGFLFYFSCVTSGTDDDACVYLDYNSLGGIRRLILSVVDGSEYEFRRGLDSALEKFGIWDIEFNETKMEDKRRAVSTFRTMLRAWNAYKAV